MLCQASLAYCINLNTVKSMLSGSNSRYTLAEQDYLMVSSHNFMEEETEFLRFTQPQKYCRSIHWYINYHLFPWEATSKDSFKTTPRIMLLRKQIKECNLVTLLYKQWTSVEGPQRNFLVLWSLNSMHLSSHVCLSFIHKMCVAWEADNIEVDAERRVNDTQIFPAIKTLKV